VIREACAADRGDVFNIWKVCFGDSDDYINFFLDKLFEPYRCLLYFRNDEPAAMLQLLPIVFKDGLRQAPAQYIYAAATLPRHRRLGIMAELIESAVSRGEKNGCGFTALVPANDGLYDYYEKCGFNSGFHLKRARAGRKELEGLAAGGIRFKEIKPDKKLICRQRIDFFKPSVLWGGGVFEYILDEWLFTGGEILASESGYCLFRYAEGALFVKELCASKDGIAGFITALLKKYDGDNFIFHLPETSDVFSSGATRQSLIRSGLRTNGFEDGAGAYFNMMLD
jgi:GNAT superfamily N-acetyltransferase